jgi:hypothetical protein
MENLCERLNDSATMNLKFTGLAQNFKLAQQFEWRVIIRGMNWAQILGQPCEFYLLV